MTHIRLITVRPKNPLRYEPDAWNGADVAETNCLAYALDEKSLGWPTFYSRLAQGSLFGDPDIAKQFRMAAAHSRHPDVFPRRMGERDAIDMNFHVLGLERIRAHALNPNDNHIVAFYFELKHFYRLDASGIWSHKGGEFHVRNCDAYGDALHDLGQARLIEDRYAIRGRAAEKDLRYYRVMKQPTVWAKPVAG